MMLATETPTHDRLPKLGYQVCERCIHRESSSSHRSTCTLHGHLVKTRYPACEDYSGDSLWNIRAAERTRAHTEAARLGIPRPERPQYVRGGMGHVQVLDRQAARCSRAPVPVSDRCPRCGGPLLDDWGDAYCFMCGTVRDIQPVSYRRPLVTALPFLPSKRQWGT